MSFRAFSSLRSRFQAPPKDTQALPTRTTLPVHYGEAPPVQSGVGFYRANTLPSPVTPVAQTAPRGWGAKFTSWFAGRGFK